MDSWMHHLAAWWPPGRHGQATAAAGVPSAAGSVQVFDGLQTAAQERSSSKEHLVVMVHGLFGTRDNWRAISGLLTEYLDPAATLLFVSHCNERTKTFDGVDACGERLAAEICGVAAQHPGLRRISILGHSMGGLISRYAMGRLYDPANGTMAGLAPCHFVAMATPHLGCDARNNPAQVPLINWLAEVPAVGGTVHGIVSELAAPVSQLTLGRVGRQFFLTDDEEDSSISVPQQPGQGQQQVAWQQPASADGGGVRRREPLLYRLTQDHPDEGLLFIAALASFETRTLYANSSGDHLVGWANSSLRRVAELPQKSGRGTGVVLEDPLELAWAPWQRPQLHVTAATAALRSGEGRQVSQGAILRARSAGQLAASGGGTGGRIDTSSGAANSDDGTGQAGVDGAAEASSLEPSQQLRLSKPGLAGVIDLAASSTVSASGNTSGSSSLSVSVSGSLLRGAAASEQAVSSNGSTVVSGSGLGSGSARAQRVEEMLGRLQALSWRRVDVCFGATLLPMLSHQHIQMQRWWVNWPGRAVVKHLALQIQAMEQLRQQEQQQVMEQHQDGMGASQRQEEQAAAAGLASSM